MATNPSAFGAGAGALAEPSWLPADSGFLAFTADQVASNANTAPSSGVLNLARVNLRSAALVTNVVLDVITGGTSLTAGQNFAALYTAAGALVAATADQSANWAAAFLAPAALAGGPYQLAAGFYWVGFLCNNTAGANPAFLRAGNANTPTSNFGLGAAASRYAQTGAALTAAPASFTPNTLTQTVTQWWAALS